MKRSALARGKPLAREKALSRSTRVAPVNRKRRAQAYARNFGGRADAVRAMECLAKRGVVAGLAATLASGACPMSVSFAKDPPNTLYCSCPCEVQAAHARARGMGGAKGDRRDLIPLCQRHHTEAGEARTSQRADFESRYKLSLTEEAARIAVELDERGLP